MSRVRLQFIFTSLTGLSYLSDSILVPFEGDLFEAIISCILSIHQNNLQEEIVGMLVPSLKVGSESQSLPLANMIRQMQLQAPGFHVNDIGDVRLRFYFVLFPFLFVFLDSTIDMLNLFRPCC